MTVKAIVHIGTKHWLDKKVVEVRQPDSQQWQGLEANAKRYIEVVALVVDANEYKLTGGPLRGRSPAYGTSALSDGLGASSAPKQEISENQLVLSQVTRGTNERQSAWILW